MRSTISLWAAAAGTLLLVAVAAGTVATMAGGLSAKQQYLQNVQNQDAARAANAPQHSKTVPSASPALSAQKATRAQGILDIHQGPVPASQFGVTNQWTGPVPGSGDVWYRVFAGANFPGTSSAGTPAIYVDLSTPTPDGYGFDIKFVGIYTIPAADTWLTVTAVNGSLVDLMTQSGRVYHFDLTTKSYR